MKIKPCMWRKPELYEQQAFNMHKYPYLEGEQIEIPILLELEFPVIICGLIFIVAGFSPI